MDNNDTNDLKPFTQEGNTDKPKKNNNIVVGSVVAGLAAFTIGGMVLINQKDTKDTDKTTQTTGTKKSGEVNGVDVTTVDAKAFKSIPDKVIDYTEEPFNDGYVLDDSHLTYVNNDMYQDLKKSGKHIIYIGRPNCPFCHVFRQNMDVALKELDMNIYSMDTIYARYDGDLLKELDELGVASVPELVVIENGKVVKKIYDDFETDPTKEQLEAWLTDNYEINQ